MNELALFAGAGGGILGGRLLGWRTRCAVEIDPYCRRVLLGRQRDGILEQFPIWDDVRTFDGKPWRGHIDIITGGFPCTDISVAGKGAGIHGEQSSMWFEMARIIREVGPRYVFVENSPILTSRGLGHVLGDLAEMGFDAEWCVLGARHAGAPHKRDRIWVLATHTNGATMGANQRRTISHKNRDTSAEERGWEDESIGVGVPHHISDTYSAGLQEQRVEVSTEPEDSPIECGSWWKTESDVGRVVDGLAYRMDRLRVLGNGQVPAVVQLAFQTMMKRICDNIEQPNQGKP